MFSGRQVVNRQAKTLTAVPQRYYEPQKLYFNENGTRNSISGVKATVFGGTSVVGATIGGSLTSKGSACVYPHRAVGDTYSQQFRELKVMADMGYKTAIRLTDFTCPREVGLSIKDSNVVVCAIGSKTFYNTEEEFVEANIDIPRNIAKCVAENPGVKRFIYISHAGADPNSPSPKLRTKWAGEQEVKRIYPDVTILRPTTTLNLLHIAPSFPGKWM